SRQKVAIRSGCSTRFAFGDGCARVRHAIIYNPRAIRTVVVLALAWAIALGFGEQRALHTLSRRSLVFLGLSAIATAVSWLAYYRALQLAAASHVAPIDKMSLPLTLVLAA
ncbi:MAG: hypothetical protein ABIS29_02625, partial [Vicinamibacterales bacterium]